MFLILLSALDFFATTGAYSTLSLAGASALASYLPPFLPSF